MTQAALSASGLRHRCCRLVFTQERAVSCRVLPGFDADQVQQRCAHDHRYDATNTQRDLHRKPVRDVEQRHVANESQQNAKAINR